MLKEFKQFISRGNVLDMAVGVIIASAFGKIVSSLVADIFTPVISLITGGVNFSESNLVLRPAVTHIDEATGEIIEDVAALTLNWGNFVQNIIDFLLVAICVFIFVKVVTGIKEKTEALAKKKEAEEAAAAPAEPPKPSNEELLLTEIRDLLKDKNN
jgi:large conductance mechanosensitive channel